MSTVSASLDRHRASGPRDVIYFPKHMTNSFQIFIGRVKKIGRGWGVNFQVLDHLCLGMLVCLDKLHELNQVACIVWVAFFHCKVASVFSNGLLDWMQSDIGCTCLTFLRYAFSSVCSKHFDQNMQNYTGCTCRACLSQMFLNVFWKCLNWSMHNELMMQASIVFSFFNGAISNESSDHFPKRIHGCTGCIGFVVPKWMYSSVSSNDMAERI